MPFIMSRVNVQIDEAKELKLKSMLGKAIEFLPGLSEKYLLAGFEDNCRLYLRGDNSQPVAYIEVGIFANENHIGYDEFSAALTKIFADVLNMSPLNVYVKFSDINAWSVGGIFFDRNGGGNSGR